MKKRSSTTKPKKTFSAEQMMLDVASSLVRDFQVNLNDPSFCNDYLEKFLTGDVAGIRGLSPAIDDEMDVARYKATYQIQSVLKRYRFQKDLYSDKELLEKAVIGFKETQSRLAAIKLDALTADCQRVLDLAACYCHKVLGRYSDEEHRNLSRFGTKASVGIPAREACEAARWELPISGSPEQIAWFDSEMSEAVPVQDYWRKQKAERVKTSATYQEISSLTLTLVPKTFKSLRAILPNTTIGSYSSYGLGEMIRKRLRRKGYDIKTLQMRHRYLAKSASVHGLSVTADLSSASDSITCALVKRLLPADWYKVLASHRIGCVLLPDGTKEECLTHSFMGSGYTFPLQTLVFLSLLKAIEATLFNRLDRRTISVYGDDLIYSSRMHTEVVHYFQQFGFVINIDKTFDKGHFRESCGGDYFRGVDVRPFQPKNGPASVGSKTYEAMLYKCLNGILARWDEHEVALTLTTICRQLEIVTGKLKIVPGDFPDDSGVKCHTLHLPHFLRGVKIAKPVHVGHGVYRFSYLRLKPEEREERRHEPYIWLALRGGTPPNPSWVSGYHPKECLSRTRRLIETSCTVKENVCPLINREVRPILTTRSYTGSRLRRTATFVTVSHTGSYTRQSGRSCFADRR
jgi:hypothetical protein